MGASTSDAPDNPDEQNLEMESLLADIARGARVGPIVASMRPSRDMLGQTLVGLINATEMGIAAARIGQQIKEMKLLLESPSVGDQVLTDRFAWAPWLPAPESPARDEHDQLEDIGWPAEFLDRATESDFGRPLYFVRRLVEGTIDNLRSIGILMQSEQVVRAPLVLARVAVEASARAWHILEPAISAEERLARTLNGELDVLDERAKAARREKAEDRRLDAENEASHCLKIASERGLARSKENRRRLDPYLRASEMIDAVLEREHHSTYSFLSDFIHSQEDEGWRLSMGLADGDGNPHQPMYLALHCLGAVVAFAATCERLEAYAGWDLSGTHETRDHVLLAWAHGAGLADDHYRALAEQQIAEEDRRRDSGSTP